MTRDRRRVPKLARKRRQADDRGPYTGPELRRFLVANDWLLENPYHEEEGEHPLYEHVGRNAPIHINEDWNGIFAVRSDPIFRTFALGWFNKTFGGDLTDDEIRQLRRLVWTHRHGHSDARGGRPHDS